MRKLIRNISLAFILLGSSGFTVLSAQELPFMRSIGSNLEPANGIAENVTTNLHIENGRLWVGPFLNTTNDNGQSWEKAVADSLSNGLGRVFSVDVEGDVIWAGLGFSKRDEISGTVDFIPTAKGFVFSEDGGQSWNYRFPQLDQPGDSIQVYGVSTLKALPIIVPEQSPPYDIDYDPITETVWTAAWASGLRKSVDKGQSWQRVILPPDTLFELSPDRPYNFRYSPERRDTEEANNLLGFSVLVDETGDVWAGSAAGLNQSTDGGESWRRFIQRETSNSLIGNWIISIEEQPKPGRNPVWMACWRATGNDEQFGVTVTRDGGESFERYLIGEKVYDFAFAGDKVFVAGDSGLFITDDDGATWTSVNYFEDLDQSDRIIRAGLSAFSVAAEDGVLWVGTEDGLVRSFDEGATWKLFRTEVPLHPDNPTDQIPDVDTYAYPNPFSPRKDQFIRLRYDLSGESNVTIRIFDFGMNPVRELIDDSRPQGAREETWDGLDNRGVVVANGVYFYAIETSNDTVWGKILLVE